MTDDAPSVDPAAFWPHGDDARCVGPVRFMGTGWGSRVNLGGQDSTGASFDYACVTCDRRWYLDRLVPRGMFGDEVAQRTLDALTNA